MWDRDKEKFLQCFKWDQMREELKGELGDEEREEYIKIFQEMFWEYRAVFWDGNWANWSRADIEDIEIEVIEGKGPWIDKYRRQNAEKSEVLKDYVNNLITAGVVQVAEGTTPWASNPHVCKQLKQTSEGPKWGWRFCCDYRSVNGVIQMINYRMKLMDQLLERAAREGRWFLSFDLSNYYFLLPVAAASRPLTAFYYGDLIMQYTTLAQGQTVSAPQSQRVTDAVSDHCPCKRVVGYVDDFLSWGWTLMAIRESVENLLAALSRFRLLIGPRKTALVRRAINFLGYTISHQAIHRVQMNKITDLQNLRSPKDKDGLRSILGLLSWFANRANIKDQLVDLRSVAKKATRFFWDQGKEESLRSALSALLDPVSGSVRAPKEPSREEYFVLFTDASRKAGLGCVLCQVQQVSQLEVERDGVEAGSHRLYLLLYCNKAIATSEELTPIALLELEALFVGCHKFRPYLSVSYPTVIYTDSRVVSYWVSMEVVSEKVARMLNFLSEFKLKVRFTPSSMNVADVISRECGSEAEKEMPTAGNLFSSVPIFNAHGIQLKNNQLFSLEKRREMNLHFFDRKRGPLAKLECMGQVVEGPSSHAQGALVCVGMSKAPQNGQPLAPRINASVMRVVKFEGGGRMPSNLTIKAREDGKLENTHLPGVNAEAKTAAEYPGHSSRGRQSGHKGWADTADQDTAEQWRRRRMDGTAELKLGTDLDSKENGDGITDGMTHKQNSLENGPVGNPREGLRIRKRKGRSR